jgi:hypothetical protein
LIHPARDNPGQVKKLLRDRDVIVAQNSKQAGQRFEEWAGKVYQAIADGLGTAKASAAR